jgi:hypothetical protein
MQYIIVARQRTCTSCAARIRRGAVAGILPLTRCAYCLDCLVKWGHEVPS